MAGSSFALLVVLQGPLAGKAYPIKYRSLLIGRGSDCQIQLAGYEEVSREHAQLTWDGNQFVIEDLGSRNGIVVGKGLLQRAPLADGDTIRLGDTLLKLVMPAGPVAFEDAPVQSQPQPARASASVAAAKPLAALAGGAAVLVAASAIALSTRSHSTAVANQGMLASMPVTETHGAALTNQMSFNRPSTPVSTEAPAPSTTTVSTAGSETPPTSNSGYLQAYGGSIIVRNVSINGSSHLADLSGALGPPAHIISEQEIQNMIQTAAGWTSVLSAAEQAGSGQASTADQVNSTASSLAGITRRFLQAAGVKSGATWMLFNDQRMPEAMLVCFFNADEQVVMADTMMGGGTDRGITTNAVTRLDGGSTVADVVSTYGAYQSMGPTLLYRDKGLMFTPDVPFDRIDQPAQDSDKILAVYAFFVSFAAK
jgi:pSer/pThr/pTyr-binding forkhead associated (FHA) protein